MRSKRLAYAMSLILATGGLAVAVGLTAAPAYASVTPPAPRFGGTWNHSGTITGAAIYIQMSPVGEIDDGYICDTSADGHRAHGDIYSSDTGAGGTYGDIVSKDDANGTNTCTEFYDMNSGNYKVYFEVDTRNGANGANIQHWESPIITGGFSNAGKYTLFARSSGALVAAVPYVNGSIVVCDTEADGHRAYGEYWFYDATNGVWDPGGSNEETAGANKCVFFINGVTAYASQIQLLSETKEGSTLINERWSNIVHLP